jgi:hypothetical protein
MVHLRRGETLRRYFRPGLDDGKTFVFWGRNYNTGAIAGPERSLTWVNQPQNMHGSRTGADFHAGQARYANACYNYEPNFANGDYREGVVAESEHAVTFEFYTPFIIGAMPPDERPWSVYEHGCRHGLVLHGKAHCNIALSVDQGQTWRDCGPFHDPLDLTDQVKGHRQYFIRFDTSAKLLAGTALRMTTVCQANAALFPRLKDDGAGVTFLASNHAVVSAGPNRDQARAHIIAGQFDTPRVTLQITTPRQEPAVAIYAAAHVASGNPPAAETTYQIDYSIDEGHTW